MAGCEDQIYYLKTYRSDFFIDKSGRHGRKINPQRTWYPSGANLKAAERLTLKTKPLS